MERENKEEDKKVDIVPDAVKETQVWKAIFGDLLFGEFKPLSPFNSLMRGIAKIMQLHPYNMSVGGKRIIMYTFCLGGLSVFFFTLLACTGAFLMIYYNPDVNAAYANIEDMRYIVPFGVLIRNMHRWTAHLMVLFVGLHMLRVFLTAAYKPPRELNWIVGVILLIMTMLASFTGYLLPWDQLAYWGVTIGTSMGENAPVLGAKGPFAILAPGKDLNSVLLGGTSVGQPTLLRFYLLHAIAIPLGIAGLMGFHFWRIRRAGGVSGPL
jgi:quinol-cytochrome oxidoreductase complex cytochrome b subunit